MMLKKLKYDQAKKDAEAKGEVPPEPLEEEREEEEEEEEEERRGLERHAFSRDLIEYRHITIIIIYIYHM